MSSAALRLAAAALVLGCAGGARAAVISATPDAALTATPLSISFGGTEAYAFTAATAASTGNGPGAAVATSGTAEVSNLLGLTDFEAGATIDQTGEAYNFAAFPAATVIPNSPADDFIGLAFTLADGLHYGYAEVAGAELVSYGYQSTPGSSILTGATATVPEPATVAMLLVGMMGVIGLRRRTMP